MTAAKKRKGPPNNKRVQDLQEIAIILSHAATFGTGAAAKQFGLNRKTIQRYQSEARGGANPELARLVATETRRARDRSRSKLQSAMDALLDRIRSLEGVDRTLSSIILSTRIDR